MVAALALGGALLLAMAVTAGYAARTLPAGARVPVNAGMPEYSAWLSKRAGLAAWLGIGVAAFAVFAAATLSSFGGRWAPSVRVVLLPCVMTVVLAAEAGAVIVARRCAAAEPGTGVLPEEGPPEEALPEEALPEEALPEEVPQAESPPPETSAEPAR